VHFLTRQQDSIGCARDEARLKLYVSAEWLVAKLNIQHRTIVTRAAVLMFPLELLQTVITSQMRPFTEVEDCLV